MATPHEKQFFKIVEENDTDAVKRYIEENNIQISITNMKRETAAHIAVRNGNLSLLKFLISRDKELLEATEDKNFTVLHLAIKNGFVEIVKYLVDDLHIDIFATEHRFCEDTAVHIAAEEDQLTILKYFLEDKKIDVNVEDGIGGSPLFLAAEKAQMRIVKYLIEDMKANATMKDFHRDTILHRSARIGDLSVPKYLLDEKNIKIEINWTNVFNRTILHAAARHNGLDFIKYFVEQKNANYEISDNLGVTPLHEAANQGHLDVVKYLVEKGAKIDHKNKQGKIPAEMAKDEMVIQYLNEVIKTRSRRSVRAFEPTKYTSFATKLHQIGLLHNSIQSIVMNSPRVEGYKIQKKERLFEESPSNVKSFLIIALALFKNSKNLANTNGRNINLLSPRNMIDSKMDPLAINAVTEDHYFSDP